MSASAVLTSCMDLELNSYAHVEVQYTFCRYPTVLLLLEQTDAAMSRLELTNAYNRLAYAKQSWMMAIWSHIKI